ncbi:MAG: ABC transporter permease subunit [Holosporaceae bacterium]|nr:MAG: ABC transporter permease subunit [Holosporaceae bacterium]
MVYCYLPFMVLPLYTNLIKFDPALLEAAADLSCTPWKTFLKITLPLSLPGIIAGCTLVFIPCIGEFVIPEILGALKTLFLEKQYGQSSSAIVTGPWPLPLQFALLFLWCCQSLLLKIPSWRARMKTSRFGLASLIIGYVFLYTPLISLVMFSFNSSKQVIFWTGFSMKWYKALFMNSEILNATLTSLEIAAITATGATILGAISAIIILKFKKFRGKNLFEVLVSLPLLCPKSSWGLAFYFYFSILSLGLDGPALAQSQLSHLPTPLFPFPTCARLCTHNSSALMKHCWKPQWI